MKKEKFEVWFYRRMIRELVEIMFEQKTDSIGYVVGMLGHDYPELKEESK